MYTHLTSGQSPVTALAVDWIHEELGQIQTVFDRRQLQAEQVPVNALTHHHLWQYKFAIKLNGVCVHRALMYLQR